MSSGSVPMSAAGALSNGNYQWGNFRSRRSVVRFPVEPVKGRRVGRGRKDEGGGRREDVEKLLMIVNDNVK